MLLFSCLRAPCRPSRLRSSPGTPPPDPLKVAELASWWWFGGDFCGCVGCFWVHLWVVGHQMWVEGKYFIFGLQIWEQQLLFLGDFREKCFIIFEQRWRGYYFCRCRALVDELSNNHLSIFSAVICLSCPMVVNSAHTIGSWSLRTEQRRRAF